MDYNEMMAAKAKANKEAADKDIEGQKAAAYQGERATRRSDRNWYEEMKNRLNTPNHEPLSKDEQEDWLIANKAFNGPTNSAMQQYSDSLKSQMPLNPTSEEVEKITGITPEQQVEEAKKTSFGSKTGDLSGVINEGASASETAGNRADERTQAIQDMLKNRYGAVEDYYSGSMSDAWKNLSDTDKKILLFDQLGTTLKNMSKARLPMYSAYGKSYEGQGMGEEKSMLQNMLDTSLQKGLERRNTRLDGQMKKQLEVANFPADLEMNLTQMWESGKLSNRQKAHLIDVMKNVDFMDALKAGAVSIAANGSIVNAATGTVLGHL